MDGTRGRALSIVLALGLAACQPSAARVDTPAASAVTDAVGASAAVSALDRPDDETLSAPRLPPPQEFTPTPQLADVYFDFDTHEIRAEDARILDQNAAWLLAHPTALVLIEGHTDERGTTEYNVGLGDLRAAAAMGYLASRGVPAVRMVAISYGKERPVCAEHNETCWSRNRRAHFLMKPR